MKTFKIKAIIDGKQYNWASLARSSMQACVVAAASLWGNGKSISLIVEAV